MAFLQPQQPSPRDRFRQGLIAEILRQRFEQQPVTPVAPAPLPPQGASGGGGLGGLFRRVVPQGVRDTAGGVAQFAFGGGERTLNTIGRLFDDTPNNLFGPANEGIADEGLGSRANERLGEIPGVGGAAQFGFEFGVSPANLLGLGIGGRAAALGGRQLASRLGREAAIGIAAGGAATAVGTGIRELDERGVPIPTAAGVGAALAAGFAGGGAAARAIPIRGSGAGAAVDVDVRDATPDLVPDLRPSEEVRATLRHIPADFGPAPVQRVAEWLGGAVDQRLLLRDPVGQDFTVYALNSVAGEELAQSVTRTVFAAAPRQGIRGTRAVFRDADENGILTRNGFDEAWQDVLEDPRKIARLEPQERIVVDRFHDAVGQMRTKLFEAGLIDDYGDQLYVPRQVVGVGNDVEFSRPSRGDLRRTNVRATDAIRRTENPVKYEDMETTLAVYLKEGYQRLAIAQLGDDLAEKVVTARNIAQVRKPEVFARLRDAVLERRTVQTTVRARRKTLNNLKARRSEINRRAPTRAAARGQGRQQSLDRQITDLEAEVKVLDGQIKKATTAWRGARADASSAVRAAQYSEYAPGFLFGRTAEPLIPVVKFRNRFLERTDSWERLRKRIDAQTGRFNEQPTAIAGVVADAVSTSRSLSAAGDLSAFFVQQLPQFGRDPASWGRTVARSLRSLGRPGVVDEFLTDHEATLQVLARNGSPVGAGAAEQVSASSGARSRAAAIFQAQRGEQPRTLLGRVGERALSVPVIRRLQQNYDDTVLMARIDMVEGLQRHWTGSEHDLVRHVDHLFGTINTRNLLISANQRQVEGAFLAFSPRMLRSTTALVADAMKPWTPQGEEALVTMMRMAGAATLFYYATAVTQGMTQEQVLEGLNPLNGRKFLSVQVGDEWIGAGGQVRSIMQFVAKAMAEPSGLLSLDQGENPLLQFYLSRAAVGTGFALGALEGLSGGRADALAFKDFDNPGDWLAHMGKSSLPFVVQNLIDDGQLSAGDAVEYFGLRGSPASTGDIRDAIAYERFDRTWGDLSGGEKQELEQQHPRLVELAQQNAPRSLRDYRADVARHRSGSAHCRAVGDRRVRRWGHAVGHRRPHRTRAARRHHQAAAGVEVAGAGVGRGHQRADRARPLVLGHRRSPARRGRHHRLGSCRDHAQRDIRRRQRG